MSEQCILETIEHLKAAADLIGVDPDDFYELAARKRPASPLSMALEDELEQLAIRRGGWQDTTAEG